MTDAIQSPLGLDKPHRNQYLFSDHYLEDILRRQRVWTDIRPESEAFLAWLRELYGRERNQLAVYNEPQLEDNWFKPIFAQLGHVWESQASVPGLDKIIKKPDYVFFPDEATRQAAVSEQRSEEYAREALAAGEVKAWGVNLSKKLGGQAIFDNNNPMFQIDYYLKITGLDWGIVSNGRLWRLVHKDSSYKLDIYFEVDLEEALTTPDDNRALAIATYFYLFFRQAAFLPDAQGDVFLDQVLAGSQRYAVALEADLRDNAYKALEQLITGFFAPSANGLDPNDPADRERVYRNSLLLLYRLLFLLYGESRGLLPMGNEGYRDRSLTTLARTAARHIDDTTYTKLPPMTRQYWAQLAELFKVIDGRDADLNRWLGVPRYNGGLFDPARHPFLEDHYVGDQHLVRAIDYLARRRKTENGRDAGYETVDYRTLGVRQLGSIYEGLLEYRVSLAEEEMVAVRKKNKETWVPAASNKSKVLDRREPGELYLATDKGERKATGSYYTPDYIVKYIVEQTLGPLVAEAREQVKVQVAAEKLSGEAARERGAELFEEAILKLNVLDPAMGSGHFLVDATNFLARALATDEYTTAARDGDEADLTYWRRRVVEACIYGVDKNELAVELAKLSLWLVTVSGDKPLSFLDHHLRHGDSLIGAWLKDLDGPPGGKRPDRSAKAARSVEGDARPVRSDPLFDESAFTTNAFQAVGGVAAIERMLSDDIEAVHTKEQIWSDIHDNALGRWRRLADLWVSAWFGNEMSAEEYADLARRIQGRGGALLNDDQAARFLEHPAATDNDYFHWELEFPEVFFDEFGRPLGEAAGFDAVVGNPPYGIIFEPKAKAYMESRLPSFQRNNDLFVAFGVQTIEVARSEGLVSLIVPNTFLLGPYYDSFRNLLLERSQTLAVDDFGFVQVFDDPDVFSAIYLAVRDDEGMKGETIVRRVEVVDDSIVHRDVQYVKLLGNENERWLPLSPVTRKAQKLGFKLEDLFYVKDVGFNYWTEGRGKKRGGSIGSRVLYDGVQQSRRDIPYLKGSGFSRYSTPVSASHWLRSDYEALLDPKLDTFRFSPEFLVVPRKIVYRQTADSIIAALDEKGWLVDKTVHVIVGSEATSNLDLRYILALLNSRLFDFMYTDFSQEDGRAFAQVKVFRIKELPVRNIGGHDTTDKQDLSLTEFEELFSSQSEIEILGMLEPQLREDASVAYHDLLAHLAQQMITLHQDKQTLTADFWTDLEGVVADAAVFAKLREKGKQEASLAKETTAAPFVDAESRSTRTLDESLGWDEEAFKAFVRLLAGSVPCLSGLLGVYRDHAPRYKELVERIDRTDWLIDQIVYQLYGLTEEEIAIVEGRA